MPRLNQAHALAETLRALADDVDAGKRRLSPALRDALASELGRDDEQGELAALNEADWEAAWGEEIDRRLAEFRTGTAVTHRLEDVVTKLRARR